MSLDHSTSSKSTPYTEGKLTLKLDIKADLVDKSVTPPNSFTSPNFPIIITINDEFDETILCPF